MTSLCSSLLCGLLHFWASCGATVSRCRLTQWAQYWCEKQDTYVTHTVGSRCAPVRSPYCGLCAAHTKQTGLHWGRTYSIQIQRAAVCHWSFYSELSAEEEELCSLFEPLPVLHWNNFITLPGRLSEDAELLHTSLQWYLCFIIKWFIHSCIRFWFVA